MANVKHAFTSAKSDGGDATLVRPSDWNANHKNALSVVNVVTDHNAAGDGVTDDLAEIHAARDAAGVGGTIFFPEGTFLISAAIIPNVAGQRWLLSKGATIKLANAAEDEIFNIPNGIDGLTFEGPGTLDGNRANQTTTTTAGIFVGNAVDDLTIKDLRIIEIAGPAIRLKGATGTVNFRPKILNNYIDGTDQHGIFFNWETEDALIQGNTVRNIGDEGIKLANSNHNCRIVDNHVDTTVGIAIEIASASSVGCIVSNNEVLNGGTFGISLGGGNHNCVVSDNVVVTPQSIGIELIGNGITCVGNVIKDAGSTGIARHDSNGIMSDNVVDGFAVVTESAAAGIKVNESAAVTHENNIISNNVVRYKQTAVTGTLRGIWLQCNNASEVIQTSIIRGNRVIDSAGAGGTRIGIELTQGTGTIANNMIEGNFVDTSFTTPYDIDGTKKDVINQGLYVQAGTKTVLDSDHTAAADPHAGYVLESLIDAVGDLVVGSADNAVARLAKGSDGQVLEVLASETLDLRWASRPFTLTATILAPVAGFYMIWRAPFACTVTKIQGHVDVGTTTTINARLNQTTDFLSSDLAIAAANAWSSSTTGLPDAVAVDDDIEVEIVNAGTAGEVTIQIELTRP